MDWETIVDVIQDTCLDTLKLIPFLFLTYLLMEWIEHKTGNKTKKVIEKSGRFGPLLGGLLGVVPQCGFSTMAANLYAGRIITMGTIIAIFLSTSDEMLPILISENAPMPEILKILGIKIVIGIIAGFIIDIVASLIKKAKKNSKNVKKDPHEGHDEHDEIGHICDDDHCHCEKGNIFLSAFKHTIGIIIYILVISFILNLVIAFIGEEALGSFVQNRPIVGPILAGLIGLIPNCASSVVLTDMYLEGFIGVGSMIAGLLVNSGLGLLVLFKANKQHMKNNFIILGLMYAIGVLAGIILSFIM